MLFIAILAMAARRLFEIRLALYNRSFFSEKFVILYHFGPDGHQKAMSPIDSSLTIQPNVSTDHTKLHQRVPKWNTKPLETILQLGY